jgi:hypothetical protein
MWIFKFPFSFESRDGLQLRREYPLTMLLFMLRNTDYEKNSSKKEEGMKLY